MKKLYNILLVDDSKTTMYYNRKIIGYFNDVKSIHEVYDGLEALNFLKKENVPIDIILLDLNMPVMDGFEFLNEYKKLYSESKIKIAILTTSNWNTDKKKIALNKHLISGYIEKPLKKESLIELFSEETNKMIA